MNQSNWPVIESLQWFLIIIQRPQFCYVNCLGHSQLPIKAPCAHNHSWIKVTESHLFIVSKYLRKLKLLLTILKKLCHGYLIVLFWLITSRCKVVEIYYSDWYYSHTIYYIKMRMQELCDVTPKSRLIKSEKYKDSKVWPFDYILLFAYIRTLLYVIL